MNNLSALTLILRNMFFDETGCHLDVFSITACRGVCRQWHFVLSQVHPSALGVPLYGFCLPSICNVSVHWGMYSERGVLRTTSWKTDSEVFWRTDPDYDHGDFTGNYEGSPISPLQAYQL